MDRPQEDIPSPCVRNCCLDERDICLGCFRTLDEICNWAQANATLRKQILANCSRRRADRLGGEVRVDSG